MKLNKEIRGKTFRRILQAGRSTLEHTKFMCAGAQKARRLLPYFWTVFLSAAFCGWFFSWTLIEVHTGGFISAAFYLVGVLISGFLFWIHVDIAINKFVRRLRLDVQMMEKPAGPPSNGHQLH